MKRSFMLLPLFLALSSAALGRTIELDCFDITGFAVISPEAPLQSWVGTGQPVTASKPGNFSTASIDLIPPRKMLLRFDISQIPKDMRVTSAELVVPIAVQPTREVRWTVYRMVAEWGAGVCEQFRIRRPKEIAWTDAGAGGVGTDRAQDATARVELNRIETEARINVTADVEMWQDGAVPNHGWLFCIEEQQQWMRFVSPIYLGRERWKLRITYEPKP